MDRSTIAAIATPEGAGGIGIIKISGPDALPVAEALFRRRRAYTAPEAEEKERVQADFASWRLYFGHICVPGTSRILDEVVLAVMRAPYSYTREDVVEIQAHSGPRVLQNILDLLIEHGVRPAAPGEFTRRAFVNGRIDLTQAEAVADLINADSDAALNMAVSQVSGGLRATVEALRHALLTGLSALEAAIDFPEAAAEDVDASAQAEFLRDTVLQPVSELIRGYEDRHHLRDGLQAVIVGGPNVGKSSLMNRLVSRERAIVTDIPGTTRDCIEAKLTSRGVTVVLADTAGLRADPDPVERLGIEKTREYLESADIVLFVVDAGCPVRSEDLRLVSEMSDKRMIVVVNKCDLPGEQQQFLTPAQWRHLPRLSVSARYGEGLDALKERIIDFATENRGQEEQQDVLVPNWRQRSLLDRVHRAVSDAVSGLENHALYELASIDLREALSGLDEITGRYVAPDVLDRIFSQYCVGK